MKSLCDLCNNSTVCERQNQGKDRCVCGEGDKRAGGGAVVVKGNMSLC